MSQEQKKASIIKRAVTFTGLSQNAAAALVCEAQKLSLRKLRRVIGAIQRNQDRGLLMLEGLVAEAKNFKKVKRHESRRIESAA